jgi:hypothetical protein
MYMIATIDYMLHKHVIIWPLHCVALIKQISTHIIIGNSGLTLVFYVVVFSLYCVMIQAMKKKNIRTILTHRWFLIQFFVRLDSLSFWELPSCSSSNLAQDSIYNSTVICRYFGLYDYLAL